MARNETSKTISLITSVTFPGKSAEFFTLPEGVETIGDLLRYMGRELDYSLFGSRGDSIDDDVEVSINGKGILFCAEGLDTPLHHGDKVEVLMLTLGGG